MPIPSWACTRAAALLALLALPAACGGGGSSAPGTPAAQVIAADGSSTVFPVTEAFAEEFQKANPGMRVTVGSSGTGGGFEKFCRDETDISDASRPISASEVDRCVKAGIEYIELPVAYDGLAVVVNPKNTWATSITVAELKKMWEPAAQGKVTRWSQVGGPEAPIVCAELQTGLLRTYAIAIAFAVAVLVVVFVAVR